MFLIQLLPKGPSHPISYIITGDTCLTSGIQNHLPQEHRRKERDMLGTGGEMGGSKSVAEEWRFCCRELIWGMTKGRRICVSTW